MNRTLNKQERIKSRKLIDTIFRSGQKVIKYPLLLFWLPLDSCPQATSGLQFGVSVSKRKVKQAVKRNYVKRHIREAYRLQKQFLLEHKPQDQPGYALFYVYIANDLDSVRNITHSMTRINQQLVRSWS
jgi:ribonuclease P protein component